MQIYFLQSLIYEVQESMTGVLAVSYKISFVEILAVVSILSLYLKFSKYILFYPLHYYVSPLATRKGRIHALRHGVSNYDTHTTSGTRIIVD
jgi:hypothetical protein